jgi:hypothetical protein
LFAYSAPFSSSFQNYTKRKNYCGNVEAETPVSTVRLGPPKDPYNTNMLGPSSKWMCLARPEYQNFKKDS